MNRNKTGKHGPVHPAVIAGSSVLLAWAPLAGVPAGEPAAEEGAPQAEWQGAITFDDLPLTGRGDCTAERTARVNDALLRTLTRHDVFATGFVVPASPVRPTV